MSPPRLTKAQRRLFDRLRRDGRTYICAGECHGNLYNALRDRELLEPGQRGVCFSSEGKVVYGWPLTEAGVAALGGNKS